MRPGRTIIFPHPDLGEPRAGCNCCLPAFGALAPPDSELCLSDSTWTTGRRTHTVDHDCCARTLPARERTGGLATHVCFALNGRPTDSPAVDIMHGMHMHLQHRATRQEGTFYARDLFFFSPPPASFLPACLYIHTLLYVCACLHWLSCNMPCTSLTRKGALSFFLSLILIFRPRQACLDRLVFTHIGLDLRAQPWKKEYNIKCRRQVDSHTPLP